LIEIVVSIAFAGEECGAGEPWVFRGRLKTVVGVWCWCVPAAVALAVSRVEAEEEKDTGNEKQG